MSLAAQGIQSVKKAPCLSAFLEKLPKILQDQYNYEKVCRTEGIESRKIKQMYYK